MKKVLSLIIAAVMLMTCVFAFASCGGNDTDNNGGSDVNVSNEGNSDGEAKAKLVFGTNAAFPPYEYYEDEKIVGIDAEVGAAIAEKLGMDFEMQDMEFGSIITAVETGKIDGGMAGMTVTEDRLESVDFSNSYATGIQVVIVKEGSDITDLDGLEGKKIGVQQDTTGHIYASDEFGEDNVTPFNTGADAVLALTTGKVDAVIIDNEPAKSYVDANDGLVILETEYAVENYAIAIQKGNTELLEKINGALAELKADGTLQKIIDKYIPAN